MMKQRQILKISLIITFFTLLSCNEDEESPGLRSKISYSSLTSATAYPDLFVDASGTTTVDLTEGNTLFKMFYSMNSYLSAAISANEEIDATQLRNMFSNTGNAFSDIANSNVTVEGSALNNSDLELRSVVASSRSDAEAERARLESYFDQIAEASLSITETADVGQAGKLGSRLVDAQGIELVQIIQKSLIGALQLDYIGNVLLDEGLTADNTSLVSDNNYTQLEHNWDVAYGLLTLNPIYLAGATGDARATFEFGAGSYIWEYNKENFLKIYPAFLKGRAAIVNNDKSTLQEQATFIRTEFEKALASAALGYLGKFKTDTSDADRAHHIGEGLGFIYSLRYATIHGADAAFSQGIIDNLLGSENGFWDLTNEKVDAAAAAIEAKFNL